MIPLIWVLALLAVVVGALAWVTTIRGTISATMGQQLPVVFGGVLIAAAVGLAFWAGLSA